MPDLAVLVVATHAMIGAMLAALTEGTGHHPLFPRPDESAALAVARLRPDLLLLDGDDVAASLDATYHAAAAAGSRILLFSSTQGRRDTERMAARHGVAALVLPVGSDAFLSALAEASLKSAPEPSAL